MDIKITFVARFHMLILAVLRVPGNFECFRQEYVNYMMEETKHVKVDTVYYWNHIVDKNTDN